MMMVMVVVVVVMMMNKAKKKKKYQPSLLQKTCSNNMEIPRRTQKWTNMMYNKKIYKFFTINKLCCMFFS
jgi:hypothetical protein